MGSSALLRCSAVMTGTEVLREDFTRLRGSAWRSAHPTGRSRWTSAAIEKDAEFTPDIGRSVGSRGTGGTPERQFLASGWPDRHGGVLDDAEQRPAGLTPSSGCTTSRAMDFKVVALEPDVAVEQVAEHLWH